MQQGVRCVKGPAGKDAKTLALFSFKFEFSLFQFAVFCEFEDRNKRIDDVVLGSF